jgi:hypothetical protein
METFWRGQENPVYRAHARVGAKHSLASRLVHLANRAAYYESTLLRSSPLGAKGLHFHLEKR